MSACYARFYKCDLQVHTPEDGRRWASQCIRLSNPRSEADLQEKARQHLRRCHEVDLEVIAVTDHNFSTRTNMREVFLTHLVQQNATVAQEVGRTPLVIFPGFEADIGFHVLCLFDPTTNLEEVSECLTKLGLAPADRFTNGIPCPLRFDNRPVTLATVLHTVQEEHQGIVVAAHAFSDDGIASDGRDVGDFQNEKLLAVEVNQVPLTGRANAILNGNDPHWKRKRRPAYIMSSDCTKLRPEAAGDTSFIGFRHTWIKMSEPSKESLRQAFLDQSHGMDERRPDQSRIRFGDLRPEANFTYPKIRSIQVKGAAFLDQHVFDFSPNLNTLIGGRGTGKSSIVEYLRLSLDRDKSIQGEDPLRNLNNIKRTLEPHGTVEITIEKDERRWQIAYDLAGGPRVIHGDPIPDLARFFPCRILSQREIYEHAKNRQATARLLDDLVRTRLDELTRRTEDATRQIRSLDERILRKPELSTRLQILRTERLDLQGRVERLKSLEGPLRAWRQRLAEDTFFRRVEDEHSRLLATVRDALDISLSSTTVGSELNATPNASLIREVSDQVEELTSALKGEINGALEKYRQAVSGLLHGDRVGAWRQDFDLARAQFESLSSELAAQGTDPDSYLQYQKQLQERELAITATQKELDGLTALESDRKQRLQSLRALWREESETREQIALELTASVPSTSQGDPFVRVSVSRFGDDLAFATYMDGIVKDRRRVSNEDWGAFDVDKHTILPTDSLLASIVANTSPQVSAAETFVDWVEILRTGKKPKGCPWSASDSQTRALLEWVSSAVAMRISLWRQPDRVKVELFRQDGTRAGELEENLSVGQRCTAILALLLAQGDEPAILDQPEDDLDNEFVFRELVPLLRRQKETRQLIVATHNANIPINADAELLIALEARDGHGSVMVVEGKEAIGALDRRPVRLAAEEVLEGSEEAFRRRFEKYGF